MLAGSQADQGVGRMHPDRDATYAHTQAHEHMHTQTCTLAHTVLEEDA